MANCSAGARCFGGMCDAVLHACVCDLGYNGTLCEIVRVDAVPEAWLAARLSSSLVHGALFVIACAFAFVYWANKRSVFPRINREQGALFLIGLSSLFRVLATAIDPYRFNPVREGLYIEPAYNAGLNVINNLAFALVASSYAVLLGYWVTVRTARGGTTGWSPVGRGVFIACVAFNLVLAVVMAFLDAYVTSLAQLIFSGVLAIFMLCVGLYIVISAIKTLQALTTFKNPRTQIRMKRLAMQLIVVGIVFLAVVLILVAISLLPWASYSILSIVWVRFWFGIMIQAVAAVGILYIFRYVKWNAHMASTGSSAELTGATMNSMPTTSDAEAPTTSANEEEDFEGYTVDL